MSRTAGTVLYLAPGRWAIGPPAEVLTTETRSRLYDTPVDVLRVRGRVVVVGPRMRVRLAPELH